MQHDDSTPYQDFMKFLTQATYHSPGTKADPVDKEISNRGPLTQAKEGRDQRELTTSPDVPAQALAVHARCSTSAAATPCKYPYLVFHGFFSVIHLHKAWLQM